MLNVAGLPFELAHEGSPPCEVAADEGGLTLTAGPRSDIFIDPAQPPGYSAPDAGRLLGTPPGGDFTLSARVSPRFAATFDAGVLLVHAGPRRHAKLCYEFSPARVPMVVSVVTRETSDDCNSFGTGGEPVWLRVARTGRAWAFHASLDGARWEMIRHFALDGPGPVRVGLMPQSPVGDGCAVTFECIEFSPGAPADLRDGS
jgi:regulation of enolase protein 1 (concanavalin A-like superfamily)